VESPYSIAAAEGIASLCIVSAVTITGQAGVPLSEPLKNTVRQPIDLASAKVPVGRVHVIAERCKQCNFCITYCPTQVLEYSEDINAKGYHYPVVASGKEESCVHCKFCDLICPELAIFTTEADADDNDG
jgi:2-oxoglutarate ferredoxin oxidoreductase subunit delta